MKERDGGFSKYVILNLNGPPVRTTGTNGEGSRLVNCITP